MNHSSLLLLVFLMYCGLACTPETNKEQTPQNQPTTAPVARKPLSPKTSAMGDIGDTHIHIDYSAPSVRGRIIWGGLIAYDSMWAPGAHMATAINFNKDIKINDELIPAGTYGYFTIPGKDSWVVILNENYNQHRSDDYDEALDVLRLSIVPEKLPSLVETLTYEVLTNNDGSGSLDLMWEHLKLSLPVETL